MAYIVLLPCPPIHPPPQPHPNPTQPPQIWTCPNLHRLSPPPLTPTKSSQKKKKSNPPKPVFFGECIVPFAHFKKKLRWYQISFFEKIAFPSFETLPNLPLAPYQPSFFGECIVPFAHFTKKLRWYQIQLFKKNTKSDYAGKLRWYQISLSLLFPFPFSTLSLLLPVPPSPLPLPSQFATHPLPNQNVVNGPPHPSPTTLHHPIFCGMGRGDEGGGGWAHPPSRHCLV